MLKKLHIQKNRQSFFGKNCFLRLSSEVEDKKKIIFSEKADFLNILLDFSIACFTERFFLATLLKGVSGGVTEWFKVAVLKTAVPERVP